MAAGSDILTPQMPLDPGIAAMLQSFLAQSTAQAAPDPYEAQLQEWYQRNQAWMKQGAQNFNMSLTPREEVQFRQWLAANNVPFNPDAPLTDYDMRGFWKAMNTGDERAKNAVDPNDQKLHYPDYWKTPYHETFSAESQWADPVKAPKWNDKDQLVLPGGKVIFDDRAPKKQEQ